MSLLERQVFPTTYRQHSDGYITSTSIVRLCYPLQSTSIGTLRVKILNHRLNPTVNAILRTSTRNFRRPLRTIVEDFLASF